MWHIGAGVMQHISSERLRLVHRKKGEKMEPRSAGFDYQQRGDRTPGSRHTRPGFCQSAGAEIRSEWNLRRAGLIMQSRPLYAAQAFLSGNMKDLHLTLPPSLGTTSLLFLKQKASQFLKIKRSCLDWRATSFSLSYFLLTWCQRELDSPPAFFLFFCLSSNSIPFKCF